ncbi:DUF5994 family protein [Dermatophilaceae bacterium Sec6.4]
MVIHKLPLARTDVDTEPAARLNLSRDPQTGVSDGAWWPRSSSLQAELPSLDLAVHALIGSRVARVAYTLGLWSPAPHKLWTSLGITKLGWFHDGRGTGAIDLQLSDGTTLVLTVIPPDTEPSLARRMLGDGGHTLLSAPAMTPIERALDRWDDEGGHAAPRPHPEIAHGGSRAALICSCGCGEVEQAYPFHEVSVPSDESTAAESDKHAFAQALLALADLAGDVFGGVEGLDRASCSPNIKYLAQIGMGAAARGCSQDGWRAQVAITQGLDAARELDQAEECMRHSGLWPWA